MSEKPHDPELVLMGRLKRLLDAAPDDSRYRVLVWLVGRYYPALLPFGPGKPLEAPGRALPYRREDFPETLFDQEGDGG